jgi:hypothetical protein
MTEENIHTTEESGQNLEKIDVQPLLYLSCLITTIIFFATFKVIELSGFRLFFFLPFFLSYILTYLMILLVVAVVLVLIYRNKAIHIKEFTKSVTILGVNPALMVNRTGIRHFDLLGLITGIIACIIVLFFKNVQIVFPGILMLTMSFFFAFLYGSTKKWKQKRR